MSINKNILKTFSDPVIWCQSYLKDPRDIEKPLLLRSYQRNILENTRKYKNVVCRWGRRCVVGETPIQMYDGTVKYIKDINIGDKVVSKDKYGSIKEGYVSNKFDNGEMDIYEIYLLDGRTIKCSKNHFLLTYAPLKDDYHLVKSYKSIESGLKKGDKVVILKQYETYGKINAKEEAKLLGYLLTDGHIVEGQTPKFTGNNSLYIKEAQSICKNLFNYESVITKRKESNAYDIHITDSNKVTTNKLKDWLRSLDLLGKKEKLKNIFEVIENYDKESLGLFLNRLWSGDGCVSLWNAKDRPNGMRMELSLSSGNLVFITRLQTFLYKYGISSKIKKDNRICKFTGKKTLNYKLYFSDRTSIESFFNITGPIYGKEQNSNLALEEIKKREFKRIREGRTNFNSVRIKSINYIGKQQVYDISVDNYNNYVTNGIVTHNSGKSITFCADSLWWAQAYPLVRMIEEKSAIMKPFRIIVVCPYEAQVKELWNSFQQLIGDSPLLKDQLLKIRTSDVHLIEFKGQGDNQGSTIEGHTIGISSSNQGTSLRGVSADMLFIDEMDYIPSAIFEQVIMPISTTHHNVKMRICSTPSGKREKFFFFCQEANNLGWLHTHIPSWHNDNDNWLSIEKAKEKGIRIEDSAEFQVKRTTSSSAYEREYGAEFGEEFGGVYKHSYINRCLYQYGRSIDCTDPDFFDPGFQQHPHHKYIIGVDWNSYINGGQVVVVEYCTTPTIVEYYDDYNKQDVRIDFTGKYRLFYRRGIKSQEATQRLTRQEIIKLLRHFKIDYVYVDYGAGDTNIEELTLYGKSNMDLEIDKKLVVIDAGATTEHFDPIIGKKVKKRNKSLMVNFTALALEDGMLVLPKEEDEETRLVGQMRSYIVKGVTSRGDYAYEGEDHILDAFNLAMFGFQQKFGQLINTRVTFDITSMEDPRIGLYPRRSGLIETPITSKFKNSYRVPIRDPEKPIINKPTQRNFMPTHRRNIDSPGGMFGRQKIHYR